MKKPPEQRIIIAATVGKDGNIMIKLDFFPKMPTFEEYQKLPEAKRGCIAVINKFAALNKQFITELLEMKPPEQEAEAAAPAEAASA